MTPFALVRGAAVPTGQTLRRHNGASCPIACGKTAGVHGMACGQHKLAAEQNARVHALCLIFSQHGAKSMQEMKALRQKDVRTG